MATTTKQRLMMAGKAVDARIAELRRELHQLELVSKTIGALEGLRAAVTRPSATSRRGRRTMNTQQKAEVSRRMKAYWAKRRRVGSAIAGKASRKK